MYGVFKPDFGCFLRMGGNGILEGKGDAYADYLWIRLGKMNDKEGKKYQTLQEAA